MDGIQMEPVGKYKTDRNGSAKGMRSVRISILGVHSTQQPGTVRKQQ